MSRLGNRYRNIKSKNTAEIFEGQIIQMTKNYSYDFKSYF